MPVLAVTETASGLDACFFLSAVMMALKSKDFPVPASAGASLLTHTLWQKIKKEWEKKNASKEKKKEVVPAEPVKKTFFPSSTTILITFTCSSLSTTSRTFSSPSAATPSRPDPSRTETLREKKLSIVNLDCFALRASGRAPSDLRLVPCFVVDLLMGESRWVVDLIHPQGKNMAYYFGRSRLTRVRSCDRISGPM